MNIHIECIKTHKPNLVLLHGWGTTSAIWDAWLPLLREQFCVTCIDLPGLGSSSVETQRLSFDEMLTAVLAHIPSNSLLLGWSLGALLATHIAKHLEGEVKGLITIGFNPCFVRTGNWKRGMPEAEFDLFEKSLSENSAQTLAEFYKLQVFRGSERRSILARLNSIGQEMNASHLADTLGMLRQDCRSVLAGLAQPSLHIYGEQDRLVPVDLVEALPLLSNKISAIAIPKAGHLPFMSDAELISVEIMNFFHGIGNSESECRCK